MNYESSHKRNSQSEHHNKANKVNCSENVAYKNAQIVQEFLTQKKKKISQSPAKYKWIFYFFSMQILELITLATSSGAGDQRNHTLINPLKLSRDL